MVLHGDTGYHNEGGRIKSLNKGKEKRFGDLNPFFLSSSAGFMPGIQKIEAVIRYQLFVDRFYKITIN
jgi:hypothetical protein